MAKKSVVARQKKREVLIAKYADLRAKLKAADCAFLILVK